MNPKERNSNIEVLRIIAMIIIVAHHFSVHGGFQFDTSYIGINRIWIQYLQLGGKIGVDIFVLISGYYLVSRTSSLTYKALKLWLQILFYSVVIFMVSIALNLSIFSKKAMLDSFFPISMNQWWFASTYFVLLLLTPFINIALTSMSKGLYQRALLLALIMWCILPSLSGLYPKFTIISPQFSNLIWFITLYSLSAYIRLWHTTLSHTSKYYFVIAMGSFIVTFLSAVLFDYLNVIQKSIVFNPTALYDLTSITILIGTVATFLGFLQIKINNSKIINTISSATFGVYLLHDHPNIIRPLIWGTIFKNASYTDSNMLIPYSIMVIALVYLTCTFIELLRIHIIEKPCLVFILRISQSIDYLLDKFFDSTLANRL